jgi:hypothetical protein
MIIVHIYSYHVKYTIHSLIFEHFTLQVAEYCELRDWKGTISSPAEPALKYISGPNTAVTYCDGI